MLTFEESAQFQLAPVANDTQTMLYGSQLCLSDKTTYSHVTNYKLVQWNLSNPGTNRPQTSGHINGVAIFHRFIKYENN